MSLSQLLPPSTATAPASLSAEPNLLLGAGDELSWITQVNWAVPLLVISAAMAVLWFGRKVSKGGLGRRRSSAAPGGRDLNFDLEIARLEDQSPVEIAKAKAGLVHLQGTLRSAQGSLGGDPARARVWYNRAGASKDSAVGVELCLLGDATGQVALSSLGEARVVAPEQGSPDQRFKSLQLGDEVQVLGEFVPEQVHKANEAASERVYGSIGLKRGYQLRLLSRKDPAPTDPTRAREPDGEAKSASPDDTPGT